MSIQTPKAGTAVATTTESSKKTAITKNVAKEQAFIAKLKENAGYFMPVLKTPERMELFFNAIVLNIAKNADLLDCSAESWVCAAIQVAQYNLNPNPMLGQAWLVPYNNNNTKEVQLQIGKEGYKELAMRTGKVWEFRTESVYANDLFSQSMKREIRFADGKMHMNQFLEHEAGYDDEGNRGEIVGAYTQAVIVDDKGSKIIHRYMTVLEMAKYRSAAKSKNVWNTWEAEMYEKTVSKQFCKRDIDLRPADILIAQQDGSVKLTLSDDMILSTDYQYATPIEAKEVKQITAKAQLTSKPAVDISKPAFVGTPAQNIGVTAPVDAETNLPIIEAISNIEEGTYIDPEVATKTDPLAQQTEQGSVDVDPNPTPEDITANGPVKPVKATRTRRSRQSSALANATAEPAITPPAQEATTIQPSSPVQEMSTAVRTAHSHTNPYINSGTAHSAPVQMAAPAAEPINQQPVNVVEQPPF